MTRIASVGALAVSLLACSSSSNDAAGWPSEGGAPVATDAGGIQQGEAGSIAPADAADADADGGTTDSGRSTPGADAAVSSVVDGGAGGDSGSAVDAAASKCPAGFTDCGSTCANLGTNPNFCGTCTTACTSSGSICAAGVCKSWLAQQTWSAASSSTNATVSTAPITGPGGETLAYDDNSTDVYQNQTFTFSAMATSSDTFDFAWTYAGYHAFYEALAELVAYADGPNGTTTVTLQPSTSTSGNFTYSGTASLPVTSGYAFGFIASGSNYDSSDVLQGTVTITED
jgi:hypothetical protein